ncbi:MAG: MFS transporter [Chloroflexi bacterium]|nr:MFS transporter [Chloroflexota bacterium]
MLNPILPLYVSDVGGSALIAGFVLAAFSVASFGVRPLVGYLVDRWTPQAVHFLGNALLVICGLLMMVPLLPIILAANAVRGSGWAGMSVSGFALLSQISPAQRRGEAAAYYTVATSVSSLFGPALGLWLVGSTLGYAGAFVFAAFTALVALVTGRILAPIASALQAARPRRAPGPIQLASFIDVDVLPAAFLQVCVTMTVPAFTAFLPLYARQLGVENAGLYFVATGLTGLLARAVIGRYTDRMSRTAWIALGFGLSAIGMAVLRFASVLDGLILGGVITSIGWAIVNTVLLAAAIDLGNPRRPGAAMATFTGSFQVGPALGSPIAGLLIETLGFHGMYVGAVMVLLVGLLATLGLSNRLSRPGALRAADRDEPARTV